MSQFKVLNEKFENQKLKQESSRNLMVESAATADDKNTIQKLEYAVNNCTAEVNLIKTMFTI
jgi:hypothetical protein